jgi:hypothetical protein
MSANVRRNLIGAGLTGVTAALLNAAAPRRAQADEGVLAGATIRFGSWMPPLDRFPNVSPPPANHHDLCPDHVTIRAGGCLAFVISGFHHVLVYDDGTLPGDINTTLTVLPTNPPIPAGPPLINDPNRRVYRGLDPSLQPLDRVEVVHFPQPGTYLVACGVLPHFRQEMWGFIHVLP